MPLPNGLPEWVFPGTLLRRDSDESLWTIIEVSNRRECGGPAGDITVTVEAQAVIANVSGGHNFPAAMLLAQFRPANNERAHHLVPIEGAHGEIRHPVWLRSIRFTIDFVNDEYVGLQYEEGEGYPPSMTEDMPLSVYRASVLWQELPAVLPGQQVFDAGVPWDVWRVVMGDDENVIHLRSPRSPFNTVIQNFGQVAEMQNVGHIPPVAVPFYGLVISPEDERRAFITVLRTDHDTFDAHFTGSNHHVERMPRNRVSLSPMPEQSRHVIARGFRRFQVGDLFHIRSLDVFLGVIDHASAFESLQDSRNQAVSLQAPTQGVTFVHEPLPTDYEIDLEDIEFVGNTSEVTFGFPAPPPEDDLSFPLTRRPLQGFRVMRKPRTPTPEAPVNRRTAFDRLLDPED